MAQQPKKKSSVSVDHNGGDEVVIHIGSEPIFVSYAEARDLYAKLGAVLGEPAKTDYTKGQWAEGAGR